MPRQLNVEVIIKKIRKAHSKVKKLQKLRDDVNRAAIKAEDELASILGRSGASKSKRVTKKRKAFWCTQKDSNLQPPDS